MAAFGAKKAKYPEKSLNGAYTYDLLVIGGGSGGLAASKEAAHCHEGLKVGVFDFVKPTVHGTKWGLGGTCVNVGCIPKKIMHYAGLLGHKLRETHALGWNLGDFHSEDGKKHDWKTLVHNVNDYIKGLNFNYKKTLLDARVEYINAYASLVDSHTVSYTDEKGVTKVTTADKIIIAVGGRPKFPTDVEGAQLGISSDDIFWQSKPPGKTLCVGASYISLECAGFLHELGFDTSVMVRSILLRGFDTQSAIQIGEFMERSGVRFIGHAVPVKLERLAGPEGRITVTFQQNAFVDGSGAAVPAGVHQEEFDTVLFATGREALIREIGLDKVGVQTAQGKIVVDNAERTSVENIFAIGDAILNRPELTPVAIKAGQMLAKRIFGSSQALMDYDFIPTTVFTPMEYGAVGMSEEAAVAKFGRAGVKVFASRFGVLEGASVYKEIIPKPRSSLFIGQNLWARNFALANNQPFDDVELDSYEAEEQSRQHLNQPCLAKLVVESATDRVVGWHYVGPDAGEVTQGFALAVKMGARKSDFDNLVGIHPTSAEEFTQLAAEQSKGEDIMKKGGC